MAPVAGVRGDKDSDASTLRGDQARTIDGGYCGVAGLPRNSLICGIQRSDPNSQLLRFTDREKLDYLGRHGHTLHVDNAGWRLGWLRLVRVAAPASTDCNDASQSGVSPQTGGCRYEVCVCSRYGRKLDRLRRCNSIAMVLTADQSGSQTEND